LNKAIIGNMVGSGQPPTPLL